MDSMIENYLNGNIKEARKTAKHFSQYRIYRYLREDFGFSDSRALAIAAFLKTGDFWQESCDAI